MADRAGFRLAMLIRGHVRMLRGTEVPFLPIREENAAYLLQANSIYYRLQMRNSRTSIVPVAFLPPLSAALPALPSP
jgi:hypothetical protein